MKIISKMLVGALAFAVTNVYAAELMMDLPLYFQTSVIT